MDGTFGINWKPAGISMEDRVPQLIIYPNPTENLVNFVWEGPKEGHISIQDITGKTIIKKDVVRTNGSTLSFDISNFPSGIYLYKAELDGEISSGKLEKH